MAITNTLIKLINDIKSAGVSYKDANFYKDKKEEIEVVFKPTFEDMSKKFQELISAYENLKAIPETSSITIEIELIKNNISSLKKKIDEDDYDKQIALNTKKNLETNFTALVDVWKKYISDKTSKRSEMLITLDKLIADMPEKKTLELQQKIFLNAKVGESKAVDAIRLYVETYDKLMNQLDLKENISDFLKKLASGEQISVMDMDEEVYKWLKTSGFANKILLKIN